jgi:hypothetical protein
MKKTLLFKWTTSRSRDTWGYSICSLWVEGKKVAWCKGGGYDMVGTCLGDYIAMTFQDKLKTLNPAEFSGLIENKGRILCDGGCGFSSMEYILNALGYRLQYHKTSGQNSLYTISPKEELVSVGK